MTPQELAAELDGIEYPGEPPAELQAKAKAAGLVIVFGASDDLMEFRGAIYEEAGVYDGGTAYIDPMGLLPSFESVHEDGDKDDLRSYFIREPNAVALTANWSVDGYSWTYTTDIPHATFEVMEGDEKYCRGIVFRLGDCCQTGSGKHGSK